MATLTPLTFYRDSEHTPWGFRLTGGADYKKPLVIQRVTPDSLAAQQLIAGDAIITLEGEDARSLCHFDACDLVKNSGRSLAMTIRKASSIQYLHAENISNQEKLEQTVVEEQKQQELERKYRRAMSTPPRDSDRSTPQRIVSPNSVSSPRSVQSPPYRLPSPQRATNVQRMSSPKQITFSPPARISPASRSNQGSTAVDPRENNEGSGVISPPSSLPPMSPLHNSHLASNESRGSPFNTMSPPVTGNKTPTLKLRGHMPSPFKSPLNITSPPNLRSPPIKQALPINMSITSSEKYYSPIPVHHNICSVFDDSSASAYSSPAQLFSPKQLLSQEKPINVADSNLNAEQLSDRLQNLQQESESMEPSSNPCSPKITADTYPTDMTNEEIQRKQLQQLIQEKLRLEEKMMIAKRREGRVTSHRQETSLKPSPNLPKNNGKPKENTPTLKLRIAKDEKEKIDTEDEKESTLKSTMSETITCEENSRSLQEDGSNYVDISKTESDITRIERKPVSSVTENKTGANSGSSIKQKNCNDETNKMIERIKKTAKNKIAELQKTLVATRTLDETEKEKLREENRIRDEEIRKMQEHNLDEKQKKGSAKSAYTPETNLSNKKQDLRRVKTDAKQMKESAKISVKTLSMNMKSDAVVEAPATKTFEIVNTERMGMQEKRKTGSELEKTVILKIKEDKRKEELKKLQEQFKKDQQLIQEEMKKKEMKAKEIQMKAKEEAAKQQQIIDEERKAEEKRILAKVIYEEEQKLIEQKKELEEKIKREEFEKSERIRKMEVQKKIDRERKNEQKALEKRLSKKNQSSEDESTNINNNNNKEDILMKKEKIHKKSIQEFYESSKLKGYEQKRAEMQKAVQMQHVNSARKLNEKLRKHQESSTLDEGNIYEDVGTALTPEEKLDALRLQEEIQMREESKQYESYKLHLEEKRKNQIDDSDDYASEWDECSEVSNIEPPSAEEEQLYHEEPFDELKATSEEELIEAQEKSIRNLERQIRKQRQKDKRKNTNAISNDDPAPVQLQKVPGYQQCRNSKRSTSNKDPRQYASTGDLSKSGSRTLPITKFSPDPMEFGFKPIERPIFSRSLSNLEMGGSAAAGAAVAGAQAGAAANISVDSRRQTEILSKTQPMSASLGDLQQVSSKPPLPSSAGRTRMRHANSEEMLASTTSPSTTPATRQRSASYVGPQTTYDDCRRFTYADGDDLALLNLEPLYMNGIGVTTAEGEYEFEDIEDYNKLLSEYYAAYYEAYYQSYYRKQQEELKAGKIRAMNGPAGPPPPPPPPPFLVPGATPPLPVEPAPSMKRGASSKLSSAPQIPQATPPAALAGAMMKDKKPFTYTPGGLDLSEISPGVNGPATVPEGPPMQSRSFRILQNVVDSEASEPPSAATGGPKMRTQQQPPQQQSRVAGGSGAIPSRAFRALQQHTDGAGDRRTSNGSPPCHPMSTTSSSSSPSSPSYHSSSYITPPPPSSPPSSSSQNTNTSDNPNNNNSSAFANYSQPPDVLLYRNVAPQIVFNDGGRVKNVVNSALSKQREASPSRPWHSSVSRSESPVSNCSSDQSRLLKFISQEAADSATKNEYDATDSKKLYDGAKIPSRFFKQLQTDYSQSSDVPEFERKTSQEDYSPVGTDKPKLSAGLLRLLQSDYNKLQNDRSPSDIENNSVISSSYGELEEYFNNGMANTAAAKEHVLQELTTKFDPISDYRKPRAAPGRVFRYLQQQYDEPEGPNSSTRPTYSDGNNDATYRNNGTVSGDASNGHRNHSPSFSYLQSKYNLNSEPESNSINNMESDSSEGNINNLHITEAEPVHSKPYTGNRIPGRTFKMLQENYATHPSVLQARK